MKRKAEAQVTARCLVQAPITLFLQGAPAALHVKSTAAQVSTNLADGRHCRCQAKNAPDYVPPELQAPCSDAHQGAAAAASDTFSCRAVASAVLPCIQEQGKRSGLTAGQPQPSSLAGLKTSTTALPEAPSAACSARAAASSRAAHSAQEALAGTDSERSPSAALGADGLMQAGRQATAGEAASPAHSGLAGPSAGSALHGPATVGNAYEAEALPAPSTATAFD